MVRISLYLILVCLLSAYACSPNQQEELPQPVSNTVAIVQNTLKKGTWKVSYFFQQGAVKTDNFTDYNFTFLESGSLSAANDVETFDGTWNSTSDNGQIKVNINFTEPAGFINLTEEWDLIERTDTRLRLEKKIQGFSNSNKLTFQQN